eukprot:Filipodium_phascolosomae@DN2890_c0_g1_i1.p1
MGSNHEGQLGLGNIEDIGNTVSQPTAIGCLSNYKIVSICCGRSSCAAIAKGGFVFFWGAAMKGGMASSRFSLPTQVKGFEDARILELSVAGVIAARADDGNVLLW